MTGVPPARALAIAAALAVGPAPAAADPAASVIDLTYDYTSFHSRQAHYVVTWTAAGGYRVGDHALDPRLIDALFAALGDLRPSDGVRHCVSHTDDYPHFHVVITDPHGRTVTIDSDSNCANNIPWNVIDNGALLVQFTGALDRPVRTLFAAIEPAQWPNGGAPAVGDADADPEIDMGAAGIGTRSPETLPVGAHAVPSVATTCLTALEASAPARKLFGGPVQVEAIDLSCKVGQPCDALEARARVRWAGVHVAVTVTCTGGVIEVGTLGRQLAELRRVLATRPIAAVAALAGGEARLASTFDGWVLDPHVETLPRVVLYTDARMFDVDYDAPITPNPAVFGRLGIDSKAHLRQVSARRWEFHVELDRTGKLLPAKPSIE